MSTYRLVVYKGINKFIMQSTRNKFNLIPNPKITYTLKKFEDNAHNEKVHHIEHAVPTQNNTYSKIYNLKDPSLERNIYTPVYESADESTPTYSELIFSPLGTVSSRSVSATSNLGVKSYGKIYRKFGTIIQAIRSKNSSGIYSDDSNHDNLNDGDDDDDSWEGDSDLRLSDGQDYFLDEYRDLLHSNTINAIKLAKCHDDKNVNTTYIPEDYFQLEPDIQKKVNYQINNLFYENRLCFYIAKFKNIIKKSGKCSFGIDRLDIICDSIRKGDKSLFDYKLIRELLVDLRTCRIVDLKVMYTAKDLDEYRYIMGLMERLIWELEEVVVDEVATGTSEHQYDIGYLV